MSLISAYVDQDDLGGGRYRNEIAMRPIAVREQGSLLRMVQNFADGDVTYPQVVNRAPLRLRAGNDGMRRMYPIPGNDDAYLEMGAPFVQVGGQWTQIGLGTPSRTGHTLTWTRPQTITTVQHGGHFVDLQIELRNGFVPENSRIAFPVGLTGLTRSGLNIQRGGVTVARLRPFAMIDAANPFDIRPIAHQFTMLGGQAYLVLTLPDLTGMVRPTIDPTLELQPDATAGMDTWIRPNTIDGANTFNYGISDLLVTGGDIVTASPRNIRAMLKFDLTSIPSSATLGLASLILHCISEADATDYTVGAHRAITQWYEGAKNAAAPDGGQDGSTWSLRNANGSLAWGAEGGQSDTDYVASATDSVVITGANADFTWDVTADAANFVSVALTNYGWWMINASETTIDSRKRFSSSDDATAAQRPKLAVEYTESAAKGRMFLMGVG